jgi:hypothetical protein
MPRLFSFLTTDNYGVETYFHGQFLVVETVAGKGKRASFHFQVRLQVLKDMIVSQERGRV